jgi:hypothetical protein
MGFVSLSRPQDGETCSPFRQLSLQTDLLPVPGSRIFEHHRIRKLRRRGYRAMKTGAKNGYGCERLRILEIASSERRVRRAPEKLDIGLCPRLMLP